MGLTNEPYRKLRGRIREVCGTQATLAMQLNMSYATLCNKLSKKYLFDVDEVASICNVLKINNDEIGAYFFDDEVTKNGTSEV